MSASATPRARSESASPWTGWPNSCPTGDQIRGAWDTAGASRVTKSISLPRGSVGSLPKPEIAMLVFPPGWPEEAGHASPAAGRLRELGRPSAVLRTKRDRHEEDHLREPAC